MEKPYLRFLLVSFFPPIFWDSRRIQLAKCSTVSYEEFDVKVKMTKI